VVYVGAHCSESNLLFCVAVSVHRSALGATGFVGLRVEVWY